MLVSTFVTHNAYTAYCGKKHRAGLPYLVIKRLTVLANIVVHVLDINIVCVLEYANLLTCNVAKNTYRQPRTRERMTLDKTFGHAKLVTYTANFVLEQPLQRLAELQMHFLR